MKTSILTFSFLFFIFTGFCQNYKKDVAVIMNSPRLSEVIPNVVEIEILGEGLEWTEGPLWLEKENKLLFQIFRKIQFLNGLKKAELKSI